MKHGVRLGKLTKGDNVRILDVTGEGGVVGRLSALGFLPGRIVEIIHIAPLQDPITVRIDRQEISVRRADANHVLVENVSASERSALPQ